MKKMIITIMAMVFAMTVSFAFAAEEKAPAAPAAPAKAEEKAPVVKKAPAKKKKVVKKVKKAAPKKEEAPAATPEKK
jgi:hypothetical protein